MPESPGAAHDQVLPPAPSGAPQAPPAPPAPPGPPVAAEVPPAPSAWPLKVRGSFWTRYELRSGYLEHGLSHPRLHREGDYVVSRARLSFATNPVDVGNQVQVSATFVPQAAYTFGENTGAAPTISDHPTLALYEGYASVGSSKYRLDAGRFVLNYGDALVLGDLGWNEAARAFNGARVRFTPGEQPFYIDLLATLITDGRLATQEAVSGDAYFYGLYAGLGPLIAEGIDLDAYLLAQSRMKDDAIELTDPTDETVTTTGSQDAATFVTLGSRVKGKASFLDYRAEAGIQFGKRPVAASFAAPNPNPQKKFGYQLDAEVGVAPTDGVRIGLEGLIASGDDLSTTDDFEGYDELYPTAHKFLGWNDIIGGRTNVASAVLHLKIAPAKPLTLSFDGHYFTRPQAGADGKDGSAGQELDTQVLYAIGGGAALRAMYGVFVPNEGFWEAKATSPDVAGDALHFFELQFGYNF